MILEAFYRHEGRSGKGKLGTDRGKPGFGRVSLGTVWFGRRVHFFPHALLAGFSFRTGEHKAFAVRKIAAKPEQVPILHKLLLGNVLGNLPGNVPSTFFGKKR